MEGYEARSQMLPGLAPGGQIPLARRHQKVREGLPIPGRLGLTRDSVACGPSHFSGNVALAMILRNHDSRHSANKTLNME